MSSNNNKHNGGTDGHFEGLQHIEIEAGQFDNTPDTDNLRIMPTRNLVLFPGVTVSFELGRDQATALAERAASDHQPIGIVCQLDPEEESPAVTTGLYKYGVFADVLKVFKPNEDSAPVAVVHGRERFRIMGRGASRGRGPFLTAKVKPLPDTLDEGDQMFEIAWDMCRKNVGEVLKSSGDPNHILDGLRAQSDPVDGVNFLCTHLPLEIAVKNHLLSKGAIGERVIGLLAEIGLFRQRVNLTEEIAAKARRNMDEAQRNAFLQHQMEAIRETLYGTEEEEIDTLLAKAEKSGMPAKVLDTFRKETEKLRRFNPSTPDYSILYSYLETLLALPWKNFTTTNKSLPAARTILEEDHYGLEKVKERIVEQLALLLHNPSGRSPIICLVGAPGVGKTSIGKSVARALGRKYERVSFGGLHDESEIRGHRRTYIGAMPGRIIDAMKRVGVTNPVILLDEIDKIGQDYKGDPAAALLEVLDPEQNCHFHDNYIDVDFDLSNVLFIATANTLTTISRPLLDRMETINIDGYLLEEKMEIARRHLLPRLFAANKLPADAFTISDAALQALIGRYTSESGVRQLEKQLAAIVRKAVLSAMENKPFPKEVEPDHLYGLLGLAPHIPDRYEGNEIAGVVTGLAWTEVGGEILMAEVSLSPAKEGRLSVTGNLGNVMKESASIAYEWIKANAREAGIDPALLEKYNVHVHFPEGAIPKDGPSAGITIATAMASALRQKRVVPRTAMTGEITLRGRVLPVGGIREKILAAKRAGITDIIMSAQNRRDIDDMPEAYRQGLQFHFVDTVGEVLDIAVTDEAPAQVRAL